MSDEPCDPRWRGTPLVERNNALFSHLDPIYKWEFTRRHPYYVKNWKAANEYWAHQVDQSEFESLEHKHHLASIWYLMQLIGANLSHFPDPKNDARRDTGFESPFKLELVKALKHADWLLTALLVLPEHVQRAVAYVYLEEVAKETVSNEGRDLMRAVAKTLSKKPPEELELALLEVKGGNAFIDRFIDSLCRLRIPELDNEFPGMAYINYNAPLEDLVEQFKVVVRKWKESMGVTETRRRSDKWDEYLDVWDRREGWSGDHYDGRQEHRIKQIAKELRMRQSTVQTHHSAAFKLITGHEYDPELWAALFGTVKFGESASKLGSWRKGKQRSGAPTTKQFPADFLHSNGQFGEGFRDIGTSNDDWEFAELCADITTLIEGGRANDEIVAELELSLPSEAIDYFRSRHSDELI